MNAIGILNVKRCKKIENDTTVINVSNNSTHKGIRNRTKTYKMDLVVEPELYEPMVNEENCYVDKLPTLSQLKHGIRCPCCSRKDKVYETMQSFKTHLQTKTHQKWLADLNNNKVNHFTESEKLKELVATQRLIIAQKDRELAKKDREIAIKTKTIEFLQQQFIKGDIPDDIDVTIPTTDTPSLLEFD